MKYESSELILNDDNSVFHLHLQPEQLADKVILVGDMGRINTISSFFDKIECEVQNREFRTVTGTYRGKRITVVATGIGTDNIDIVMTELDALANIDLINRCDKKEFRKLSFVRIGTSGGMQINVPVDSFLVSEKSIGFDGVLNYYANRDKVCDLEFEKEFVKQTGYSEKLTAPYWSVRSGQFDDLEGPAHRILMDRDAPKSTNLLNKTTSSASSDARMPD